MINVSLRLPTELQWPINEWFIFTMRTLETFIMVSEHGTVADRKEHKLTLLFSVTYIVIIGDGQD